MECTPECLKLLTFMKMVTTRWLFSETTFWFSNFFPNKPLDHSNIYIKIWNCCFSDEFMFSLGDSLISLISSLVIINKSSLSRYRRQSKWANSQYLCSSMLILRKTNDSWKRQLLSDFFFCRIAVNQYNAFVLWLTQAIFLFWICDINQIPSQGKELLVERGWVVFYTKASTDTKTESGCTKRTVKGKNMVGE